MATNEIAQEEFYIVGIGASAGGLEALEAFFSNCPNDTGIAFVIVQHLSPDYKSMMPSLLARHTKMPVNVTENTDAILPNHIYLIPGNKNLIVNNGKLELLDRAPSNQLNLPIDLFFESLAKEKQEKAIGVILSGTGSDGTRGGKFIKEVGGTLFVQDPETIRFDGMPLSAIENGLADYVMAASEIPNELINFVHFPNAKANWEMKNIFNDSDAIDEILRIIRSNTGYDFLPYRRQTLTRRIIKRLKINKLEGLKEYIELLESDITEQRTAVDEFLIGVTKFFRDPKVFKVLEKRVIPAIIKNSYKNRQDIKAWSVGSSSGEEAYSIAILIEEAMEQLGMPLSYKVFATDIDAQAIEAGSKGIYKKDIMSDIPNALLGKYFINKKNGYQIKPEVRKNIIFSKHDILQNPPFNKMDLISCRNMLIYLNNKAQKKALASLHFALRKNGFLFLGSSESLGPISRSFEQIDRKAKIYKNIDTSNRVFRDKEDLEMYTFFPKINTKSATLKEKLGFYIGQDLVDEVGAACVFVDDKFDIVHAKGNLNRYIVLPEDGFSNNIMSILPSSLNIPISTSIRSINSGKYENKYVTKEVQHIVGEERIKLKVRVSALPSTVQNTTFLISILEVGKTIFKIGETGTDASTEDVLKYQQEIKELRQALDDARENLQLTVEELETTSEEIQATNEELIASNEELQSTNEELQSVNEELHTVNAELQEKNVELLELNSDMENLINSTNIGTIFLDKKCHIRRFTPAIAQQLHLRDADIGRSVSDFSWSNSNLEEDVKKVLQTLQPVRKEIQTKEGIWFLEQILPYRTQDDVIKGVVVNFINIDSLKTAIKEKEQVNHFMGQVTNLSPGVIYVYDLEKETTTFASESIYHILGYSEDQLQKMGSKALEKIVLPAYVSALKAHGEYMKTVKDNESGFVEIQVKDASDNIVWLSIIDKVFERNNKGEVTKLIGFATDSTQQKFLLNRENENLHLVKEITTVLPDIVYVYDSERKSTVYINRSLIKELGYSSADRTKIGKHPFKGIINSENLSIYNNHLRKLKNSKKAKSFYLELQVKNKKGKQIWISVTEKVFERNEDGRVSKIIGTIKNINANRLIQLEKEKLDKLVHEINEVTAIIYILDLKNQTFEYMSKAVERMLGYTSQSVLQMGSNYLEKLIHTKDLKKMKLHLSKLSTLKDGEAEYIECRLLTDKKNVIWVEMVQKIFERDKHGNPTKVIGICQDITLRKNNQLALKESNEKLERFAYISSHDLKEPLNTIISSLDLLKLEIENHPSIDLIQPIEDSTARMKELIEDLLEYSLLNKRAPNLQELDLNKLLDEVRQDLGAMLEQREVNLTNTKLPSIYADKTLMKQLFQNLIGNAVKYNDKKLPKVKISAKENQQEWVFSIKDNGIGIEQKNFNKIFNVFKKLHGRDQYSGTGIGLANCKSIVQAHQGKIWIESTIKKGSTFFFSIPKNQA